LTWKYRVLSYFFFTPIKWYLGVDFVCVAADQFELRLVAFLLLISCNRWTWCNLPTHCWWV